LRKAPDALIYKEVGKIAFPVLGSSRWGQIPGEMGQRNV
jgi:hypothetical protein